LPVWGPRAESSTDSIFATASSYIPRSSCEFVSRGIEGLMPKSFRDHLRVYPLAEQNRYMRVTQIVETQLRCALPVSLRYDFLGFSGLSLATYCKINVRL